MPDGLVVAYSNDFNELLAFMRIAEGAREGTAFPLLGQGFPSRADDSRRVRIGSWRERQPTAPASSAWLSSSGSTTSSFADGTKKMARVTPASRSRVTSSFCGGQP